MGMGTSTIMADDHGYIWESSKVYIHTYIHTKSHIPRPIPSSPLSPSSPPPSPPLLYPPPTFPPSPPLPKPEPPTHHQSHSFSKRHSPTLDCLWSYRDFTFRFSSSFMSASLMISDGIAARRDMWAGGSATIVLGGFFLGRDERGKGGWIGIEVVGDWGYGI